MPAYLYGVIAAAWLIWFSPFVLAQWNAKRAGSRRNSRAVEIDQRARWGVLLQGLSYAILWQNPFWTRSPETWRLLLSLVLLPLACLLSWTAPFSLGRQWRLDAGLNREHELITTGPYRMLRHPIYASMLCMLLGMGFIVSPMPLLLLAIAFHLAGTEIRVRIEDKLLASRFGTVFADYRRKVPAYLPFIR